MARFPCHLGDHRYPGPQRSLYVSSAPTITGLSGKARLCQPHFEEIRQHVSGIYPPNSDQSPLSKECDLCTGEKVCWLWLDFYDQGAEPEGFAAALCVECAEEAAGLLSSMRLEAR